MVEFSDLSRGGISNVREAKKAAKNRQPKTFQIHSSSGDTNQENARPILPRDRVGLGPPQRNNHQLRSPHKETKPKTQPHRPPLREPPQTNPTPIHLPHKRETRTERQGISNARTSTTRESTAETHTGAKSTHTKTSPPSWPPARVYQARATRATPSGQTRNETTREGSHQKGRDTQTRLQRRNGARDCQEARLMATTYLATYP